MNRIEGFQTETEQGIRIPCNPNDGAIYIGDDFSIVSHNDRTTSIHSKLIVFQSSIAIPSLCQENPSYELCPNYVSITKNGSLVMRRYYTPLYIALGLFAYTLWFKVLTGHTSCSL